MLAVPSPSGASHSQMLSVYYFPPSPFLPTFTNATHSYGSLGTTAGQVFPQSNVGPTFSSEEGMEKD